VLGGGNTAMDCCRRAPSSAARRQGDRAFRLRGDEGVSLGKEEAPSRGHSILNFMVPIAFTHDNGKAHRRQPSRRLNGRIRCQRPGAAWCPPGEAAGPDYHLRRRAGGGRPENAFSWIEREFASIRQVGHGPRSMPRPNWVRPNPKVFSAATPRFGPKKYHLGGWRMATTRTLFDPQALSGEEHHRPSALTDCEYGWLLLAAEMRVRGRAARRATKSHRSFREQLFRLSIRVPPLNSMPRLRM